MNATGTSTEYKAEDDFQLIEDAILGVAGARNALTRRVQELSPRAAEAVTNMFNQGLEDARNGRYIHTP